MRDPKPNSSSVLPQRFLQLNLREGELFSSVTKLQGYKPRGCWHLSPSLCVCVWLCWVLVKIMQAPLAEKGWGRFIALRLVGCGSWLGITPIPLHLHWREKLLNHRTSRELLSISLFIWIKQLDRKKQADLLVFEAWGHFISILVWTESLPILFPWELASRGPRQFNEFLTFANQKLLANP